jgi:hypothetical protein
MSYGLSISQSDLFFQPPIKGTAMDHSTQGLPGTGPKRDFWPGPVKGEPVNILPVFLPFWGCPRRCIYCAQDLQTGKDKVPLDKVANKLRQRLQGLEKEGRSLELGFFGGTFTGLPQEWLEHLLDLANEFKAKRVLTRIRCSTRPDFLSADCLKRLSRLGLDLIEVGVQSFDDLVLEASRRDYKGQTAIWACKRVQSQGLDLGIQLLPGLPLHSPETWTKDIALTVGLEPECVRIYPCLVLDGTPLAHKWKAGEFSPWSLRRTVTPVGQGLTLPGTQGHSYHPHRATPGTRVDHQHLGRPLAPGPWRLGPQPCPAPRDRLPKPSFAPRPQAPLCAAKAPQPGHRLPRSTP